MTPRPSAQLEHVLHEVTHMPDALGAIHATLRNATPIDDGMRSPSLDGSGHQTGTHSDPTADAATRHHDRQDPALIHQRLLRNVARLSATSRAIAIDCGLLGHPLPRMPRCDDCGRNMAGATAEQGRCPSCARGHRRKLQRQLDTARATRRVG